MKLKSFANIISALIIILFMGFVFYLGWEQLELEENTYGVVYTKISGWRDEVLDTKGFNWSPEKVIPTIYTVHKFKIEEHSFKSEHQGYLSSYKLYLPDDSIDPDNFKYNCSVIIDYKLKEDQLTKLVKSGLFTQATFDQWEKNNQLKMKELIESYLNSNIGKSDSNHISNIEESLSEFFSYYSFKNIIINLSKPDTELYSTLKERYLSILKTKSDAEITYISKSLEQQNDEILKLDLLKKYGEVFTQYPIMIEYIKVDNERLLDRAEMEDFIQPRNQN